MSERRRRNHLETPRLNPEHVERAVRLDRKLGMEAIRRFSKEEEQRQATLDLRLIDALNHLTASWNTTNKFKSSGILTIRDLLVAGPHRTNTSTSSVNRAFGVIKDRYPDLYDPRFANPLFEPAAADIAEYCHSLSQVNARVLPSYEESYYQLGRTLAQNPRIPSYNIRMTVADILDPSNPIMLAVDGVRTRLDPEPFPVEPLRLDALAFAESFVAARQAR